jgi:nitrogenase-associated protein
MPSLKFWWKPGCTTNTRQIALLRAAGVEVDVRDLLAETWTQARLGAFFVGRPVAEWFNPAAPAVKNGLVDPASFDAGAALERLVAEPLLIRRPLIEIGEARCSGFDKKWLAARGVDLSVEVPEGCSHGDAAHGTSCPLPLSPFSSLS